MKSVVNVILGFASRAKCQCIHRRTQKSSLRRGVAGLRSFSVLLCPSVDVSVSMVRAQCERGRALRHDNSSHVPRSGATLFAKPLSPLRGLGHSRNASVGWRPRLSAAAAARPISQDNSRRPKHVRSMRGTRVFSGGACVVSKVQRRSDTRPRVGLRELRSRRLVTVLRSQGDRSFQPSGCRAATTLGSRLPNNRANSERVAAVPHAALKEIDDARCGTTRIQPLQGRRLRFIVTQGSSQESQPWAGRCKPCGIEGAARLVRRRRAPFGIQKALIVLTAKQFHIPN